MTKTVTTGKATDLITFTRSTTGTYLDSVKYGDELVTNGDFSNGTTGWDTSDGNITVVNGQLVINATPTDKSAYQQITLKPNTTYKVSIQLLTDGSYLYAYPQHNSNANTISGFPLKNTTSSGSVVNHSTFLTTTDTGELRLRLYTTNGDTGTFDNLSVKELIGNQGTSGEPLLRTADTNEPRIEYDADGNLKGLLIEEQRSNNLPQSNNASVFDLNASGITTAVNSSEVQAPSNTETVIKLNKTGGGYGYARTSYTTVSSAQTLSVFVKKGTARYVGLRQLNTSGSSNHTTFDLETKTWTHTGYSDFRGYQDYGNGWLRIWVSENGSTKSWASVAIVNENGTENNSETGTLYVYGFQREAGSFPTSYIPTSGSTVTRNADVATINVSEFEYNTTEGSISMEIVPPSNNSGEQQWILGSNTNSARWAYTNAGFDRAIAYDGVNTFGGEDLQPSTINKIATGTDQSTAVIYVNGESLDGSQATNGNIASLTTIFYLGGNFSTGNVNLGGHIKSIKYYPVRLTNNQLKALTQ